MTRLGKLGFKLEKVDPFLCLAWPETSGPSAGDHYSTANVKVSTHVHIFDRGEKSSAAPPPLAPFFSRNNELCNADGGRFVADFTQRCRSKRQRDGCRKNLRFPPVQTSIKIYNITSCASRCNAQSSVATRIINLNTPRKTTLLRRVTLQD